MSIELRDSEEARTYLTQGIWLQRLADTNSQTIAAPIQCAMNLAANDEIVPPVGFIADVIRLVLFSDQPIARRQVVAGSLSPQAVRSYDDYVLGKLYSDATFERASVAICRYETEQRIQAIAWLIARICDRINFEGVVLSPAVARSLQGMPAEDLLTQGSESISEAGLIPLLVDAYQRLTIDIRRVGEVLSAEDVFELEKGTALVDFGQRLALRQVVRCCEDFSAILPHKAPRPTTRQRNVPTHIMEEDTYPIGGFISISTKGSIESLLHSELAFMETDEAHRPDLFELKFVRSELLYYSRDENAFLRHRRTFQFVLFPDLSECRVKDVGQSYQRLIQVLAFQVTLIRKLIEWLSDDAVIFEFHFIKSSKKDSLSDEQELMEMMLSDQIQNQTVSIQQTSTHDMIASAEEWARTSTTHSLVFSTSQQSLPFQQAMPTYFLMNSSKPQIRLPAEERSLEFESLEESLNEVVRELL